MIELLKDFPGNIVACVCHGRVTKAEYTAVLIPAVEGAIKDHDKVRLYYETGSDFEGIDPSAVWEDAKVGVGHFLKWERFAVVTDVEWIKQTMKFFGFLIPGELRVFSNAEAAQAKKWIAA